MLLIEATIIDFLNINSFAIGALKYLLCGWCFPPTTKRAGDSIIQKSEQKITVHQRIRRIIVQNIRKLFLRLWLVEKTPTTGGIGHGRMTFTDQEAPNLRLYLESGGFLLH